MKKQVKYVSDNGITYDTKAEALGHDRTHRVLQHVYEDARAKVERYFLNPLKDNPKGQADMRSWLKHYECVEQEPDLTFDVHNRTYSITWHDTYFTIAVGDKSVLAALAHSDLENEYGWLLLDDERLLNGCGHATKAAAVGGLADAVFAGLPGGENAVIHLIGVLDADVPVNQLACSADWESWEQQMSRELIALINERSARNDLACECKGSPHDHLSCSFPLSKADNCTIIFHGDYLDFQWGHSKALTPGLAQKRVVATITHTQLENEYGWILCSVSREECKYEYVSRADAVRGLVMRIFPTASPEARARAIKILNKRYLTESPKSTVPRAEHIADMEAERLSVLREVVERPAPKSVKRVATVKSATGAVIPSPPPPTVPKIPRVRVQGPNLKGIAVVKFEYTRHWSGQTSHEIGQAVYLPHGGLHISLQHCSVYVEVLEDDRRLVLRMMQRASNGLHHGGGKTELNILRGWDKNKSASDLDEFLRRFAEHISKYVGVMTDPNTWYHLLTGHEQIKSVRQFTMAMQAKVAEIQGQPTYDVWVVRTGDNVEGVYSTLQNLKDYPGMLDCDGPARYPEGGGYVQQNAPCWAALSVRDSLRLVGAQVEMRDHDPAEAIIGKSTQSE